MPLAKKFFAGGNTEGSGGLSAAFNRMHATVHDLASRDTACAPPTTLVAFSKLPETLIRIALSN